MTQKQKLIEMFFKNPSSLKFKQVVIVLEEFGFALVHARGSHTKFKHPKLPYDFVIPVHNGDCKTFYKKKAK